MIKKIIVLTCFVVISYPVFSQTVNPPQTPTDPTFSAEELKNVQAISQALLHVRGQKKRQLRAEVQPILEDIKQVEAALKDIQLKLDKPRLELSSNQPVSNEIQLVLDNESFLSSFWKNVNDYIDQALNTLSVSSKDRLLSSSAGESDAEVNQYVQQQLLAIHEKIKDRSEKVEDELPPIWKVWQDADPQKQAIVDKLSAMMDELADIQSAEGNDKRNKVMAMQQKLAPKPYVPVKPEPTLTSITKHHD
ncbi:MAG: septal ring factor EnvC (AmiA/AmiB activator) [Candidatus Endobugula sp.]|jgi:septal ring factor EnvC (AmiA/AmiB activator)